MLASQPSFFLIHHGLLQFKEIPTFKVNLVGFNLNSFISQTDLFLKISFTLPLPYLISNLSLSDL